jgi:hypothetical protein
MIDLDDRERTIDQRARLAAAGLQRAVAQRPMRNVPERTPQRYGLMIGAVCVMLLVVSGLYGIAQRDGGVADDPDAPVVWTIGGLPSTWPVGSVRRETGDPSNSQNGTDFAVYGTPAAPEGPVIVLDRATGFDRQPADRIGVQGIVETTAGDRALVLGDDAAGRRLAWVQIGQRWIAFVGSGVADQSMSSFAAALTLDPAGVPSIAAAAVPDAMTLLASGPYPAVAPTLWVGLLGQDGVEPTVTLDFVDAATEQGVALSQTRTIGADLAVLSVFVSSRQQVTVAGGPAWSVAMDEMGLRAIVWRRNDTTLLLASSTMTADQLVALADTVRPARADELSEDGEATGATALPETEQPASTDAPQGTDPSPDTLPDASPPAGAIAVDSDFTPTRTERSPNEVTLSGQLAGKPTFAIDFLSVAGQVQVSPHLSATDRSLGTWYVDPTSTEQPIMTFGTDGAAPIAVVTDDPLAASLQIVSSAGQRYTLTLTAASAHPDIRFTGMVLSGAHLVSATLLDADGRPIGPVLTRP